MSPFIELVLRPSKNKWFLPLLWVSFVFPPQDATYMSWYFIGFLVTPAAALQNLEF